MPHRKRWGSIFLFLTEQTERTAEYNSLIHDIIIRESSHNPLTVPLFCAII